LRSFIRRLRQGPGSNQDGDGRRNQQGLLHHILSSMFGLAPEITSNSCQFVPFQVDESGGQRLTARELPMEGFQRFAFAKK